MGSKDREGVGRSAVFELVKFELTCFPQAVSKIKANKSPSLDGFIEYLLEHEAKPSTANFDGNVKKFSFA